MLDFIMVIAIILSMKRITVVSSIALTTLVTGVVYANLNPSEASTTEVTPIVQQVDRHESELDNHEARITNVEADVSDLQANTNTAPSVQRVEVPEPTAPTPEPQPEPTPEPEPVTVVSYRQIPVEGTEDTDCEYTYSDGTTYQWHWQKVHYNQGTKFTNTSGYCDDRALGKVKPS